ncbi:MAG: ABC transporter substrate-binding protein [Candidatus Magnetomorum sp.]|nr:ABC transporter substrate-binding protein [Candidatus Magnetomorum sp.]
MKPIIVLHFAFIVLLLTFFSCNKVISNEERMKHLTRSTDDLFIGIVDAFPATTQFAHGVKLAMDEINSDGGVMGKRIRPLLFYDYDDEKTSIRIAEKLAKNKNVFAVIGHFSPQNAISASIVYKEAGILFFSTGADLLRYGGAYIFNNYMPDQVYVRRIAECFSQNHYQRIIILNDRQKTSKILADIFYEEATQKGLAIVSQQSFSRSETNFRDILSDLKNESFDIVLLLCRDNIAALVVNQMRELNINTPIMATDEIDTRYFWSNTGKKAEGTIIPSNFDNTLPRKLTQDFVSSFTQAFGVEPETFAARGYDLIHLLKTSMEKSNSCLPMVLNTTLRFMEHWDGVLSQYHLTRQGNIGPSALFFKKYEDGKFVIINRKEKKQDDFFDLVEDITLRLAINNDVSRLDPGLAHDKITTELSKQLFIRLTQYHPDTYQSSPDFATSWEPNETLDRYRFKLRKNVFWTNGQPVTAHDLRFAIVRNLTPETQCPDVKHLFILKNAQDIHLGFIKDASKLGVNVIDDYTIDFILSYPAAFFPSITGLPVFSPLPSATIQKWAAEWTAPEHIVSNGPFQLACHEKGSLIILRKNDRYYDASTVAIQEVRYNVIMNSLLALHMYQNNQLDILGGAFINIPSRFLDSVKKQPETRHDYQERTNFSTTGLFFNVNQSPVDNVLLRKAIASVIDRSFITRFVIHGQQKAMKMFIPPDLLLLSSQEKRPVYHPTHAMKMLAEAGYPGGKGCPAILIDSGIHDSHKQIAKAISLLLKKRLNLQSTVIGLTEPGSYNPRQAHIFISDWYATFPDANSFLFDSYNKLSRQNSYINTELSDVLNKAIKEKNLHLRKDYYLMIDEILTQRETLVIPIFYETDHYLIKPRIKNWSHMALGGQNIKDWQLN